jgi:hypothetical protein
MFDDVGGVSFPESFESLFVVNGRGAINDAFVGILESA